MPTPSTVLQEWSSNESTANFLSIKPKKAFTFIGQKYDWNFLPDNGKMYCSELVYESFKDAEGHPLFHSAPMNYYDAEGNIPQYWIDLFKKLGTDIPQGIEGTSPQGMSQEESLTEVYRYFR